MVWGDDGRIELVEKSMSAGLPEPAVNKSPHDTPEDSRGDSQEAASNPLGSAISLLRGSATTTGEEPFEERSQAAIIQRDALVNWAKREGLIIDPPRWLRLAQAGGAEHDIAYQEATCKYWKVTRPDHFGWTVLPGHDGNPYGAEATPLEYLERWQNANEVFGDDVKLRGVIVTDQGVQVVVSQPFIKGKYPEQSQIRTQMREQGFQLVPRFHLGADPNTSYYHVEEKIAVFDAAPDNFIMSQKMAVPIDVVVIRVSDALGKQLSSRLLKRTVLKHRKRGFSFRRTTPPIG